MKAVVHLSKVTTKTITASDKTFDVCIFHTDQGTFTKSLGLDEKLDVQSGYYVLDYYTKEKDGKTYRNVKTITDFADLSDSQKTIILLQALNDKMQRLEKHITQQQQSKDGLPF